MRRNTALTLLAILAGAATSVAQPYSVTFVADATPSVLAPSERQSVLLTIRNSGTLTWRREELFRVAYHWLDERGQMVVRDGTRTELPRAVAPGETISLCASAIAPERPGRYELHWDLVHEKHTWFSDRDPANALRKTVMVERDTADSASARSLAASMIFWVLTLASLFLAAYWVRRLAGDSLHTADAYLFYVVLFGAGALQTALHLLAFTAGLSVVGIAIVVAAGHAALVLRYRGRAHPASPLPSLSVLETVGSVVMLGVLIQWAMAASRGIEILGTDAAHYHVPHALNFFRGAKPFDFLATPHLYPMGTSVWAAWFFQPFDGPLLLELATAPSFALLFASLCLLFRLLTGRSGLAWAPWAVLLMFTPHLPRLSMLMSADLAYAAGFIVLTVVLLRAWQTRTIDVLSTLGAAIAAGWLVSSKSTGLFSLAVLGAAAFVLVVARIRPSQDSVRGLNPGPLAAAIVLFIASGGIWVVRNWWLYGSPLAPYGLSIFDVSIFPGQSASEMRNYLSVFGDLARYGDEYEVGRRFSESVRDMFGPWTLPAAALGLLLGLDVTLQMIRRRRLNDATKMKLLFSAFFIITFAIHAYVVAGLPWSSLDWTRGLALRYVLPFAFLYLMLLYSFVFMDALADRWNYPIVRAVGAAALIAATLYYYAQHQETPGLAADRWLGVLDVRSILLSAAVIASILSSVTARTWMPAIVMCLIATGAVAWANARDATIVARSTARELRQTSCSTAGSTAQTFEHRELYLRVVEAQKTRQARCERTRFFLVSRFDRPLDLQDSGYRNLLLDARVSASRALRRLGPAVSPCDVVVATKADIDARGERWLDEALNTNGPYVAIADYGRFVAYVRR